MCEADVLLVTFDETLLFTLREDGIEGEQGGGADSALHLCEGDSGIQTQAEKPGFFDGFCDGDGCDCCWDGVVEIAG